MNQAIVPAEILCEVFQLLHAPIHLGALDNSSGTAQDFPWAVGQVCRRWRDVFISHPPLWTSLALHWDDFGRSREAAYMAETNRRTAIYVERSGQLPLTISISLSGTRPSQTMKTLVSCSKRWKSLDICIDAGSQMELLECEGNLPNLTTLIIRGNVASNLSRIFEVTPRLTYLDVSGRIGQIAFPWAQLTRFRISVCWEDYCRYGNELWQVLLQLQNVETLELLGVPNFPSSGVTLPKVSAHLPRLLLLETRFGFFEVFSQFIAPSLEHLRIDDHHNCHNAYVTHRHWNGVLSLINRSSCHVRRLTLLQGTSRTAPVLEALADVEELIIEYPANIFPTFLRYVAWFNGDIYLPKLRVLKMKYCPAHNIKELVATMSQFLELRDNGSRMAPASCVPLEKLVIQLQWCSWCPCDRESIDISWNDLEEIRSWPSDADICVDDSEVKTRNLLAQGNA
ncbi:hypothetical protein F5887DRAFT_1244662 [Amanita rubescens]|nr:hypothetical protein F5887DRAFT_1244662 [Amanita rubescens]